ncbi:low molecular weight phosphatase family protein [Falsarthrobacter nasiphocae]|uniref:Arsenate-mycothiol transferase n=1 Tax=Falsarthrobacter nasiphocae TaxID=189863 RepID=A0AAE4C524_9MICC|nr:low molecular weight phosphatase family protein [Falsarthrobacter nasiphocae]MDR6891906.1 arsenate-mycothiol transferase [Falsarthrobacter nasiphocae]
MKTVLFVCSKNGGKSQMAAAVMRKGAGEELRVVSGGTNPGSGLNAQSVASLEARGYSVEGEYAKAIAPETLEAADVVVILGNEAQLDVPEGRRVERWLTREPSEEGIEGAERMNLILDDIEQRVEALREDLREGSR